MPRPPLYLQILVAVVLAVISGLFVGAPIIPYGELGGVIIKLLKLLATPLVFFAVIESFVTMDIPPAKGARLIGLSAVNAAVATAIGLSVAHAFGGGTRWLGKIDVLLQEVPKTQASSSTAIADAMKAVIDPLMPKSIIPAMVTALVLGVGLRQLHKRSIAAQWIDLFVRVCRRGLAVCTRILQALIAVVPLAVLIIVAAVVAKTGTSVFALVGWFLATVTVGLLSQVLVYYPLLLAVVARRSPLWFFRGALDSITTALSVGSSLASLPVTLRCLKGKLGVADDSARLAACVGTNLNHDGIILYEAAAAIFVTQALGFDLSLGQQLLIAGTSILAGIGIAGVPEAGLITLPLVLSAAGVPDTAVVKLIPLLFTVDWLIGRMRAATNVTSDMLVAVLIDQPRKA